MSATATTPTTTTEVTSKAAASTDPGLFAAPLRKAVSYVGGAAMLATPLLIISGLLTSPPQASRATADYIESLSRDPFLTSLSASLLHYGWVAMALGLVVAMTLVRTRKGRVLTLIGGLGGGFTVVQMSALMYNDWVLSALGRELDLPTAARVADAFMLHGDLSQQFAWKCATLALIFPVFLYAGLARAGVISWWLVPLSLFPMVAPFMAMSLVTDGSDLISINPLSLVVGGVVGLICYLPTFLVGIRLINRGRLATA